MKVYKLLHKPTGLFFTPSRGNGNLSATGKIYPKKPSMQWVEQSLRIVIGWSNRLSKKDKSLIEYFGLEPDETGYYHVDKYVHIPADEWEMIEL
jgi:hypothetical protein